MELMELNGIEDWVPIVEKAAGGWPESCLLAFETGGGRRAFMFTADPRDQHWIPEFLIDQSVNMPVALVQTGPSLSGMDLMTRVAGSLRHKGVEVAAHVWMERNIYEGSLQTYVLDAVTYESRTVMSERGLSIEEMKDWIRPTSSERLTPISTEGRDRVIRSLASSDAINQARSLRRHLSSASPGPSLAPLYALLALVEWVAGGDERARAALDLCEEFRTEDAEIPVAEWVTSALESGANSRGWDQMRADLVRSMARV